MLLWHTFLCGRLAQSGSFLIALGGAAGTLMTHIHMLGGQTTIPQTVLHPFLTSAIARPFVYISSVVTGSWSLRFYYLFIYRYINLSFACSCAHFHISICLSSTAASSFRDRPHLSIPITSGFCGHYSVISFLNFTNLAEVKQNVSSYNGHLCGEQQGHTPHEFPLPPHLVCSSQCRSWWANGKVRVCT